MTQPRDDQINTLAAWYDVHPSHFWAFDQAALDKAWLATLEPIPA